MLTHLYIKNFTLIDSLEADFDSGFIVLTGETGAGKSIIVDAIQVALGQRASSDLIRVHTDQADIVLTLDIASHEEAKNFLKERELLAEESCMIRRSLYRDGRSKSTINDIPVTQQTLRTLSECLITIQGQHEYQTLLKPLQQRKLLDQFGQLQTLTYTVNELYRKWHLAKEEYSQLNREQTERNAKKELLTYQWQELEDLKLEEGEIESLESEYKRLANIELLMQQSQIALNALQSDTSDIPSVLIQLEQAHKALSTIAEVNPEVQGIIEILNHTLLEAEESRLQIQRFYDQLAIDPERLQEIDHRMRILNDVARKHRVKPENLLELKEQLHQELQQSTQNDQRLQELEKEIITCHSEYFKAAHTLSQKRQTTAVRLAEKITAYIKKLGMPRGQFKIALEKIETAEPILDGIDQIQFLISANPGEPVKPINQIASGGELSRISLAIQVVTAQKDDMPILIFDEVDAGIGGATADIVGNLLRDLGNMTQLFCITHLAQIAAKGHHHFQIEKHMTSSRTQTMLKRLDSEDRIAEIARMVGGVKITEQTLAHAKELLEGA